MATEQKFYDALNLKLSPVQREILNTMDESPAPCHGLHVWTYGRRWRFCERCDAAQRYR